MGSPSVVSIKVTSDTKDAEQGVETVDRKFSGLGKTLGKIAIGAVLAKASVAAVKFAGDSVRAASDAQTAFRSVDSVFKQNATTVKQWAEGAATAVGLSKTQYATLASTVGAQLGNLGIAQDQVAGKTNDLITVGADLAATFGGTTSDAVKALSALFRGEYDPIEKYGVSIKQSAVNARLAAQGLQGLTGPARTQAETMAKLSLVMEQTSGATGAFARNSDTLAQKQLIAAAQVENLKAKFGEMLLPVITTVAAFINDTVIPAFQKIAEWCVQWKDVLIPLAAGIAAATAVLIVFNIAAGVCAAVVALISAPVTLVIVGIAALVAILIVCWNRFELFRSIVMTVINVALFPLRVQFEVVRAVINTVISVVQTVVGWFARIVVPGALAAMRGAFDAVRSVIGFVVEKVSSVIDWFGRIQVPGPLQALAGVFSGIGDAISAVIGKVEGLVSAMAKISGSVIGKIGGAIGGIFSRSLPGLSAYSAGGQLGYGARSGGGIGGMSFAPNMSFSINIDGQQLQGRISKTVRTAMDRDGARYSAGGWA